MSRLLGRIWLGSFVVIAGCGDDDGPRTTDGSLDDAALDAGAGAADDALPADAGRDVELPTLPEPEPCDDDALDDPRSFPPCGLGAGIFGRWIRDDYGLPAFDYHADQRFDPRAEYPNSLDPRSRDHWHMIGNDRVTALVHNGGHVELVSHERGVTYVNRFDPEHDGFAGGYSYVAEGDRVWATAHALLPEGATATRRFGLGYFEHTAEHDELRVRRRVFAPAGDAPLLIADVLVDNRSDRVRAIRHHEAWDANRFQVTFEPLVAGILARAADDRRRALDDAFVSSSAYDESSRTLRASMTPVDPSARPPADEASPIDHHPPDVVLQALVGEVHSAIGRDAALFGEGGFGAPEGARTRIPTTVLEGTTPGGQPACAVLATDLVIPPGESAHLRFAFGYVHEGRPLPVDPAWRDPARDVLADTLDDWRTRLAYLATESDPVVHRELAWRSFSLQAASTYSDFHQLHVVPQGSAYLYRQGLDGAARDHGLFAMPLVYLDPDRAREQLELVMRTTHAEDARISYAHHGHGILEDAFVHPAPSDLQLHLFLGVVELLAATGDRAWLDRRVPFYPAGATPPFGLGDTVLDHLRAAFRHLRDTVGRGPHGLVRVGTGDWDDAIVSSVGLGGREPTIANGESHANTALAAFVLPLVAGHVESADPAFAADLRTYAGELRAALAPEWNGRWYRRAYLRDADDSEVVVGDDTPLLLPQTWALIAGIGDPTQTSALLASIDAMLDSPSPIGATLSPSGAVWPAVSGLLTWAYAIPETNARALAWRSVVRNTFAAHAETYPEIWYGVWSGPDGFNGTGEELPGYTWSSSTPMRDFPVTNMNQEAMGLLGAIRVAGIFPDAAGLRIAPAIEDERFVLDLPLIRLERDGSLLRGELRPRTDGAIT
ncbi:MAG: hypothetical protein IT379_15200, partial [Deltaproteobacteria bacterium]|nr:hypothetical protein [Deltaproteobacteria bacterium]